MNDTSIGRSSPSPSTMLSGTLWANLLKLIGERQVIPVIGPELLRVPWDGNAATRLYDLWGQALAQRWGIEPSYRQEDIPLLYRIANEVPGIVTQNDPGGLECDINEVVSDPCWPLAEPLRQLAEIRDFSLYLSTTIDHQMEAALTDPRSGRESPMSIAFKQGGDADLPGDFVTGSQPTVFHLFGAAGIDRDGFAATEDALIEFSWALIDHDYAPNQLYDYLRGKCLLLLGCDFPDWLARFLIHALARKLDVQHPPYFVSECRQGGLCDFLQRKHAIVAAPQSPVTFVAELHRRWRQHTSSGPAPVDRPTASKHGSVFISYAREDRDAALAIRAQLEEARIDTWLDESGLEPGADFEYIIRDNINHAAFFVAVISRALDLESTNRLGRFVLKEWKWAENTNLSRGKEHSFLQAVVVDDTPLGAQFVDPPFRELHWTIFRDGRLPPEFIDFLKRGIRRVRSTPTGGNV